MKRTVLIVLLSLGTVGGFAAGCHSLARHRAAFCAGPGAEHSRWSPRAAFEDELADVCVRAARRASEQPGGGSTAPAVGAAGSVNAVTGAGNGGPSLSADRAAAAVDRAAAAAERAAAAAERAAAGVERATLDSAPPQPRADGNPGAGAVPK